MSISPATALDKVLVWNDFPPKDVPPPAPEQFVQAAFTSPAISYGSTSVEQEGTSDPPVYALKAVPVIQIEWPGTSWRAKFIAKWPAKNQSDLLDHEQIHYLINVISARDCNNLLNAIKLKKYADSGVAETEINDALTLLNSQAIHEKYDNDTQSLPSDFPVKQAAWATAVRAAKTANTPLRATLITAGLMPPPATP